MTASTPSGSRFKFTKDALDALAAPAPGQRLVVRDTDVKGLELRVTPNGVKTFSVRRRVRNGALERVTIGRFPEVTIFNARKKAEEHIGRQALGESVAQADRKKRREMTFDALFSEYLERHAKVRKRTWQDDDDKYRLHIKSALGTKKLSAITRNDVGAIHSKLTAGGQPILANRVLALVSSVFGWAQSFGIYDANPVKGIKRNAEVKRDRFLKPDELPAFFSALAAEPNEDIRDYILLSILTGARRANVLAMSWAHLSLESGEWRIPGEQMKGAEPQVVLLTPEAVQILRVRKEARLKSEFVFSGPGKSGHLVEPKEGWRRVLERAWALRIVKELSTHLSWSDREISSAKELALSNPGEIGEKYAAEIKRTGIRVDDLRLADLRIHDLRRTLGSWQAKTGASLIVIGKSLGHRNQATTAIYARLDQDPVRESVERATAAILEAAGLKSTAEIVPMRKGSAR